PASNEKMPRGGGGQASGVKLKKFPKWEKGAKEKMAHRPVEEDGEKFRRPADQPEDATCP
ncbi:hypothetical protein KI387_003405, partial [Taxus chinensis]